MSTPTRPCPQTELGERFDPSDVNLPERPCAGVWQYLYAGACNCDEGYWCGCSSADPDECWPSNTSATWIGHYTNESGVYAVNSTESYCPITTYCPGQTQSDVCPNLCPPGSYCASSKTSISCPEGHLCPIGTSTPRKCPRFSVCSGSDHFSSWPLLVLVALICIVIYSCCFWKRSVMVKNARSRKIAAVSKLKGENMHENKVLESAAGHSGGPDVGISIPSLNANKEMPHNLPSFKSFGTSSAVRGLSIQRIAVEFEDLRLTLPNGGPTILHKVNGSIPPGKITAIMGPSGAGKSTFLNVMAGKVQRTGGTVHINGEVADLEEYKSVIGFVPQEDIMLRELTVEEVITHSAYMRLPADMPLGEKDELIRDVIDSLGLTHVQDSIIGDELKRGISGGQRKRVSVGIEIVAKPSFLCLDEPTSGLDSVTSLTLVQTLKDLAKQGVTIIAVLHQPKYDIFQLFDNVLLLGVGGCTVYLGAAREMKGYFESIGFNFPGKLNPADHCMDIIAGLVEREGHPNFVKEDLFDLWKKRCTYKASLAGSETPHEELGVDGGLAKGDEDELKPNDQDLGTVGSNEDLKYTKWDLYNDLTGHMVRNMDFRNKLRKTVSFWAQIKLLFSRCLLQRLHTISTVPLWMALLAGALLGLASRNLTYSGVPSVLTISQGAEAYLNQNLRYSNSLPTGWSNIALATVLVSVPGIEVFGLERANFFREASTGLHVTAYWLAKTLDTLIWIPLYSLVFSALIFSLAPLYMTFSNFWLIILMTHVGFYAVGMIVSTKISPGNRGIVALISGLVLTFATSGVALKYGDSNAKGAFWPFFPFWCAQGFVTNEYKERSPPYDIDIFNDAVIGTTNIQNPFGYGYDLESSFGRNLGFATLTAFAWHGIVLAFLKFSDWKKQR